MPRVHSKQVWLSLLVTVLFAPVFLATGSAAFRPAWLERAMSGLPPFPLLVVGLLALFVVLVWLFSSFVFDEVRDERDRP